MAFVLSEEQFKCSICLDIYKNPVSIPCGHNFCLACIKRFWNMRPKSECPLCKEVFKNRPELRVNLGFKDITEQFKRTRKDKPRQKNPQPQRKLLSQHPRSEDVDCDVCQGAKTTAVKSCLFCRASYCKVHLQPHIQDPSMTKHKLTDPAMFITSHLCGTHNKLLEMFCKKDQTPICVLCAEADHKHHSVIPIEQASRKIKTRIEKTDREFKQMIEARLRKVEEINQSVEQSKVKKEQEIKSSVEATTMVISTLERNQASVIEEIEKKQEAAECMAADLLKQLKGEIDELLKRRSELQYLESTEDPLHLLQSLPSLSSPMLNKDWSKVTVHSDHYIGIVRTAFSKLVDICYKLEKTLSEEEVSKKNQYAVDVTLDPATASGWLVLSPDGKKASVGCQQKNPPTLNDPRRFDSCVSVLGKQSFTSGRYYWVVQVGDKSDWDLGIARESINRKGAITVCPDSGYWAICRRKGGSLSACAGPSVTLNLKETPQKVGIFLDYEHSSVSFYNAETKTHIYTYSGCTFTEPLYPYLNPCLHDNGKNTAPLIICPVEAGITDAASTFSTGAKGHSQSSLDYLL